MKKTFILLSLVVVTATFTACNKGTKVTPKPVGFHPVSYNPVSTTEVAGKWMLIGESGGLTGGPVAIPDYVAIYTLNADSTYNYTPAQRNGTFTISDQKSIYDGQMHPYLNFNSMYDVGGLITVKNDTLTLDDNHVDGYTRIYGRVN